MSTATVTDRSVETSGESNRLTETLEERLSHPATSPDFDLKKGVNEVLADVGMTSDDCGGELSFYGSDPILQSPLRFGTMAAIGLAARSVAVAALWRQATGEGQNISVDVRKALRRFCGFFDGKWETVNGRPPSPGGYAVSPFLKMGDAFFRETRDGRYVVALDIYPQLLVRTLDFLRCSPSTESINKAILNWDAMELEQAAAAEGLVLAMIRTNEEFRREPQYTQVLSKMPLVTVEKIGESDPVPLKASGNLPLAGIRAFGMGHVIAGGAIGRDMALYGADVLNIWRPRDSEIEAFAWDVQVGMRSTILDDSKEDRARFNQLLQDADVFFANKRPGFLKKHDLDADALCKQKPGLIHATVVLHGEKGPWSNRPGLRGRLVRHDGNPSSTAPARDRGRQLSRCGFADKDCALVALVRHLRQGLRKSDRGLDRRAHVHRSGSVYRGNAAWKLSGNDGPDRNVADARLLQNRACAARLEQTRMAGGLRALYRKGVR